MRDMWNHVSDYRQSKYSLAPVARFICPYSRKFQILFACLLMLKLHDDSHPVTGHTELRSMDIIRDH